MRLMKRKTKTKNNKFTAVLSLSLLVCAFMSACSATVEDDGIKISPNPAETEQEKITMQEPEITVAADTEATLEEAVIPESEWQLDVTFPDWRGDISSTYPINNCVGFYGYSGQGRIYLECDDSVSGFELFVNGRKIDVSSVTPGKSYLADVSLLTVNGINSVQVGALEEGNVRICIPYPVIIPGTPDEAGIDESVWDNLVSDMAADAKRQIDSEGITDEEHPRMKAYKSLLSLLDR